VAKKRARKGGRYTPPKRLRPPEAELPEPARRRKGGARKRRAEERRRLVALDRQASAMVDLMYAGWDAHAPEELCALVEVAAVNAAFPDQDLFRGNARDADLDAPLWCRGEVEDDDEEEAAQERAFLGRCARGSGLPPAQTARDLVAVAEHYGLLRRDATGRLVTAETLPLVTDLGLLEPEQAEEFLAWRRGQVLAELPESILDEFERRESDEWRTTPGDLARLLRVDLDLMRQALERLKSERCVSLSPDPAVLGDGDDFTLAWVLDPYEYDFNRSGEAETRTPNPPPLRLLRP